MCLTLYFRLMAGWRGKTDFFSGCDVSGMKSGHRPWAIIFGYQSLAPLVRYDLSTRRKTDNLIIFQGRVAGHHRHPNMYTDWTDFGDPCVRDLCHVSGPNVIANNDSRYKGFTVLEFRIYNHGHGGSKYYYTFGLHICRIH
jgi:hypothetical protein